MNLATKANDRKKVLWIHFEAGSYYILKVSDSSGQKGVLMQSIPNIVQLIKDLCTGFDVVILDSVKDNMKDLFKNIYDDNSELLLVACTSHKSIAYGQEARSSMSRYKSNYVVCSWSWEDYRSAFDAGIFGNKFVDEAAMTAHYYYAGGSIRLMFDSVENVINLLDSVLENVEGVEHCLSLLKGVTGKATEAHINSLIQVFPEHLAKGTSVLLSEYVCREVEEKVGDKFVKLVYT